MNDVVGEYSVAFAVVALSSCLIISSLVLKRRPLTPFPRVEGSSWPVFGTFLEVKSPTNLPAKLFEWAERYCTKDCGAYEFHMMGVDYVVACDERAVMEIMEQRPYKITRNKLLRQALNSVAANGLLSAEGKTWRSDRRLVAPHLNLKNVEDYFKHVKTVSSRLTQKWKEQSVGNGDNKNNSVVVINTDCYNYMMDVSALTTLGKDFDSLRCNESVDAKDMDVLGKAAVSRALSPVPFWDIPVIGQYLDGAGWSIRRFENSMAKIVEECEKEKEEATITNKKTTASNFVSKVVDSNIEYERIIGNLTTMFFGGTDSGAAVFSTALWLLAMDETGLQEEIFQEVKKLGELEDAALNNLDDASIPTLLSFLFEVYRFYSPFPFLFLESAEDDVTLLGTTLPKGVNVIILLNYPSRSSISPPTDVPNGPNGEPNTVFCPRRYLLKDGSVVRPKAGTTELMSFGHGARICPGTNLSRAVLSFTFARLIKEFVIKLEPNHPPVGRIFGLSDMPDRDIRLCLTLRG